LVQGQALVSGGRPFQPHRLCIAQLPMHWSIGPNLAGMLGAMERAKGEGAGICSFAELALTGFHRQIASQAVPELVGPAIEQLQAACARLGLAINFGAPTFAADGKPLNSHLFIDEHGTWVGTVSKIGLTAPEATFFQPGTERGLARLQGLQCSAVICREIEDAADIALQLQVGSAALLFWPGQMRPDPAKPVVDPPEHVVQAQALAQALGCYIVQANWPQALNRPEESRHTGHSAVISPDGKLLFRLPEEGFGLGVFDLGSTGFDWHPLPA
jgi:predicted amidohydrolase